MTIFQKKNKIQEDALNSWRDNKFKSLIAMCTGSGKTRVGVLAAKYVANLNPNAKILVVVPTETLRDEGWKEEFKKWESEILYDTNVDTKCYVSINKTEKDHYDLVILDECHRVTEANYEFFTKNKVDKILALTATPPKDDIKRDILHNLLKLKISFNYPLDQGVKDGVVAPFKIKIVEVNLSDKKDLVVKTKAKTYTTSEKARYDALTRVINQMMFSGKDVPVYMYLNRMRFLYDLPSKTKLAQKIIKDKFRDDERFLIFSGSIAQAETLCKHSHHSKKKNNDDLIALKAGRINRMSCVKSLNEGENIPNMDSALIVQVTSKDLDLIQRVGRVVRVREGHEAVIWILSVVNTKDADWVAKAIEGFDPNVIEYINAKNL